MYSNSYNYPPDSGSSQPGRGKVGGAGHTGGNENQFAGSVYGHGSSQNPAGQTYYPQQEMSRRPLQTMQVQNSQQMRPQHQMYHGPSQPLMYSSQPMDMYTPHDFERPHGFGRGYSEPTDFPPSQPYRQPGQLGQQGFGDVDMRFPGPAARRFQGHELQAYPQACPQACPQDPPMLSRPLYPVGDMPVAGAGYAGVPAADRMYCDTPPSGYSGFTPSQTSVRPQSTPITASGAAPATNSMCTSTSTGRGYPRASETASTANPQPPQQAPRQPGQQRQQRHVAAEVVPAVPVWTRPTPKVVKDEPNAPRGGPGGSRVVPLASVVKASTLSQPAAASQSPQSSSSRPMPSSAADKPRQPRQSGRATPNIDLGVRIITGTVENILDWGRKLSEEAAPTSCSRSWARWTRWRAASGTALR
ncbi:extensin-like [Thrips palmi]|uniref:Extensin-like n=1 Tax=Thrips palmi TaxID=161013 RepID=A0A6P8ZW97_THRPL|nr:extensin-like [Thrips palmi]